MAKKRARRKQTPAESPVTGVPGERGWEPVPGVRLRLTLRGHDNQVCQIAWAPNGRWLASPSTDSTIRIWDSANGKIVRTLTEHEVTLYSVAWSPDGRRLASGADDEIVRVWDAKTGTAPRTLEGHSGPVNSVAWSPDGRRLASGADDATVRVWDAKTGTALRTLEGHSGSVNSVAWSPDGRRLASGTFDGLVQLWDAETGTALRTLEGHSEFVWSVAWLSSGNGLVSASEDKTLCIWDDETGHLRNQLEGHTGPVICVSAATSSPLVASKENCRWPEDKILLWNSRTGHCVASFEEPARDGQPYSSVAIHPYDSLLATVGTDPGTEEYEADQLIHLWELDYAILLDEESRHASQRKGSATDDRLATVAAEDSVLHATAKIVLVGDSGVGKTGLGWRLAHGEFKEHASTHGQQFWVIDQLKAERKDGTRCEAVLWDLAGQPDYRLIHALHVADADLALILFDPTHAHDPLGSVHYWLGQLPPECPKILVPARIDRGSPTLTDEELEQFCRQQKISGRFVKTSAFKGDGLDELLERMKDQIPWDQKTAVTTTATFKRIKDFVLALKQDRNGRQLIVTPAELREMLESDVAEVVRLQPDPDRNSSELSRVQLQEFTDAEMRTAVERVASHGYVRLLTTSDNETRILLVPELLNNLAASFILEARRNPKGLGAIEEQRILDDGYDFPELDGLSQADHDLLIEATIAAFLENRLSYRCFREHAGETRLLVFPELINLKKPVTDEGPLVDDLSYSVSGATENLFASLVVTLGYTNTFVRSNQWHNQARYEHAYTPGLMCGFRRHEDDDGETCFTLTYSDGLGAPVRSLFQGLFESLLARKSEQQQLIDVLRFAVVTCSECNTVVDRTQMRTRLAAGKDFAFCAECGERLALPPADVPVQLTDDVRRQLSDEQAVVAQRAVFEGLVYKLRSRVHADGIEPKRCFLSYAWRDLETGDQELPVERWVARLAEDLEKAGHDAILDQTHNEQFGQSIARFIAEIPKSDRVLVIGTRLYLRKYENKEYESGTIVAAEMDLIDQRLTGTEEDKQSVIGLLLEGASKESLPPLLRGRTYADFRDSSAYFAVAFDLMLTLYGLSFELPGIKQWRQQLRGHEHVASSE